LIALFELLQQHEIKPLIAQRFRLAEARQAHEMVLGLEPPSLAVLEASRPI
jgi:hypothetical protein